MGEQWKCILKELAHKNQDAKSTLDEYDEKKPKANEDDWTVLREHRVDFQEDQWRSHADSLFLKKEGVTEINMQQSLHPHRQPHERTPQVAEHLHRQGT
jgi:hypothetical protein